MGNIIDTGTKILVTLDDDTYTKAAGSRSLKDNKDPAAKYLKLKSIIYPSIFTMWSDFFTYLVLLIVYITGGSHGHVTGYYGVIAVSGFVFGINMTLLYAAAMGLSSLAQKLNSDAGKLESQLNADAGAAAKANALKDAASKTDLSEDKRGLQQLLEGVNSATGSVQKVIAKFNDVADKYGKVAEDETAQDQEQFKQVTAAFNQLQKEYTNAVCPDKFYIIKYPSIITHWLNFLTFVILLIAFVTDNEVGPNCCPDTVRETPITSVKLALSNSGSKVTHTITLNGNTNTVTYTSNAITLGSGTGTITINLPGGEIKLTHLNIRDYTLTIAGNSFKVSVLKKTYSWDKGTKINLRSTANLSINKN